LAQGSVRVGAHRPAAAMPPSPARPQRVPVAAGAVGVGGVATRREYPNGQPDEFHQGLVTATKTGVEFMSQPERLAKRQARKALQESTALLEHARGNWGAMILNVVLQPLVFNAIYFAFSFYHRDRYKAYIPYAVQFSLLFITSVVLVFGFLRGGRGVWFYFICGSLFLSNGLAAYLGNENYEKINYYYTFRGMATYVNINPSLDSGKSFADAGEVYFKEGSRVDTTRAVAFQNSDLFCVAPIVLQVLDEDGNVQEGSEPKTQDWWAVGTNCCNPSGEGFTCGESTSALARSGMRLLDSFDLPYYRFAAHQWAAKYHLKAENPLFFHWVSDPLGKVTWYYLLAHREYYSAVGQFFVFNLALTIALRLALDFAQKTG